MNVKRALQIAEKINQLTLIFKTKNNGSRTVFDKYTLKFIKLNIF